MTTLRHGPMPAGRAPSADADRGFVLALSGGVGGAKLALGLYHVVAPERLVVAVNTGDDFEHLGLHISPDIDTVLYTLSGCCNQATGWGRSDETWTFMSVLETLGGETWFHLGDGDLALHVERTRRLGAGESLTEVCDALCRRMAVGARVLPMSDDPVRTIVQSDAGALAFQHYFVRLACEPKVTGIAFEGAERAVPNPEIVEFLARRDLRAVVICPSNPYLSVDPFLAVPGLRRAIAGCRAPVVAVSPLVGGRAIKGPMAKIMSELGIATTVEAIARHYQGLIDGLVVDHADAEDAPGLAIPTAVTGTVMNDLDDRIALAREVLSFASRLDRRGCAGVPDDRGVAS